MNLPLLECPQIFKIVHHGCLIVFKLASQILSVVVFHNSEENMVYQGCLRKTDLDSLDFLFEHSCTLNTICQEAANQPQKSIHNLSANKLFLKVNTKTKVQKYNDNKIDETPIVSIDLTPHQISEKQSISYIKHYHTAKEDSFKQQILKLKTQIYSLMTQLQHVTQLIKSQSILAKNTRLQMKQLKKQLDSYKNQEKQRKSSLDIAVQCNLSDSGEDKVFMTWFIDEKVQKITQNLQANSGNKIKLGKDNQEMRKISVFLEQHLMKQNFQPNTVKGNEEEIKKKKNKIFRTSSQSYINASRLSGMTQQTDKFYRMDNIWKHHTIESW